MSKFQIGAQVRAKNPDDFMADVARKLRNRVGVVTRHQPYSGRAIVVFAAIGRRKEFYWVPDDRDLESA